MTTTTHIAQRVRALLIQSLERRWPGCGAHSKRDRATGRLDVAFNDVRTPGAIEAIRAYVDGWDAGGAALLAILQAETPFPDVDPATLARGQHRQQLARNYPARRLPPASVMDRRPSGRERAAEAQAGLAALFSAGSEGGEDED